MFYQLVVSFQPVSIIIAHQGVAKCNEAHRQFIQPPPKILHRCSWVGPYMYARNEGGMIISRVLVCTTTTLEKDYLDLSKL